MTIIWVFITLTTSNLMQEVSIWRTSKWYM